MGLSDVEDTTFSRQSSFRNVVFYSYLEARAMEEVHKSSHSECYTPSSEPFRFYLQV
jgi:hypothetical protein